MVTQAEFPHGLCCIECNEPMENGDLYFERLTGMIEDDFIVELVCSVCDLKGT